MNPKAHLQVKGPSRHKLVDTLCELCRPGDLVITQGAGDVTQIGPAFIKALKEWD